MLSNLLSTFGKKMRRIRRLSLNLDKMLPVNDGKPSFWNKMDMWMAQLCGLKQKEQQLLARIKDIETLHKQQRRKKQLKMARSSRFVAEGPKPSSQRDKQKRNEFWFWLFVAYMLMRGKKRHILPTLTNG